jgi:hypothetical protein
VRKEKRKCGLKQEHARIDEEKESMNNSGNMWGRNDIVALKL